jgi:hypothetical protein
MKQEAASSDSLLAPKNKILCAPNTNLVPTPARRKYTIRASQLYTEGIRRSAFIEFEGCLTLKINPMLGIVLHRWDKV